MELTNNNLLRLLQELDEWMELEDCPPVGWVVCGGAALGLQGLQSRPTQDVDVLGCWNKSVLSVSSIDSFPPNITACIRRVTDNHPELAGLGTNWINLGPRRLMQGGLPEGFAQRLEELRVGNKLTLQLLGRQDLLALKLYAAADDMARRQEIHYDDLKKLAPTFDELDFAVEWIRTRRDFETISIGVKDVLRRLGHDDLTYYV
ncbi:MAG: hypothetical protein HN350_19830 [Phycisphaerales bacterium]|nr:hypothetical protein [Phycisphaerales bacterium]